MNSEDKDALFAAFKSLRNEEEIALFLTDVCTPGEISALVERWKIARLLHQGDMTYREIAQATGASTATIGRVARFLKDEPHGGYRLLLARLARKQGVRTNG